MPYTCLTQQCDVGDSASTCSSFGGVCDSAELTIGIRDTSVRTSLYLDSVEMQRRCRVSTYVTVSASFAKMKPVEASTGQTEFQQLHE